MELIQVEKQASLPIEFLPTKDYEITPDPVLNEALRAAEAHRRIRYSLHEILQPGVSLLDIVKRVEASTRVLLKGEKNNGIGFPCGVSLNNCAAHYTCNPGDKDIFLTEKDVLKIDFGTHCNGRIMDSAFTVCFDPTYVELLVASKEATKKGLEVIGVDMAVSEIGREINEIMTSYEVEVDGKTIPINPIENLHGHSIKQFKIHGGISIPPYKNHDMTRITEGFYAIETFATTGEGECFESGDCSHFMKADNPGSTKLYSPKTEKVFEVIKREIGSLPFSPYHVEYYEEKALTSVKLLGLRKFLTPYPPLIDVPGSFVAQFEHTVYLKDGKKEILTCGLDY